MTGATRTGAEVELSTSLARLEAALTAQLAMLGGDAVFGASADSLYSALEPAFRQLGLELAQQAASEVAAQLPDHEVEVVLADGEPTLRVRMPDGPGPSPGDDLDARLTLRLPGSLKQIVEDAAEGAGDSVNSWVVRTLATRARPTTRGRETPGSGEFET